MYDGMKNAIFRLSTLTYLNSLPKSHAEKSFSETAIFRGLGKYLS